MQAVQTMESRDIDELVIIDINARSQNRPPLFEPIKEYTSELFCPLTVGGGINTIDDIKRLLHSGADKVVLCTQFIDDPGFIYDAVNKFGSQCITVAINYATRRFESGAQHFMVNQNYTATSDITLRTAIKKALDLRVGEILLVDVLNSGLMQGYNINAVFEACYDHDKPHNTPIVPLGGCGKPEHMAEAFRVGAHAVAASSMFLFRDITPKQCARELQKSGFRVRVDNLSKDDIEFLRRCKEGHELYKQYKRKSQTVQAALINKKIGRSKVLTDNRVEAK